MWPERQLFLPVRWPDVFVSRENVPGPLHSLCGYTSVRYLVDRDIWLIAKVDPGGTEALERRLQMIILQLHPSEI